MFDWLGFRKGLPLWWSYRLNRHLQPDIEDIFEGIANTRKDILIQWASDSWSLLDRLAEQLTSMGGGSPFGEGAREQWDALLQGAKQRGSDFSELFLLDARSEVAASTFPPHRGASYAGRDKPAAPGLEAAKSKGEKLLYGPYGDPLTLQIGPSTSAFHDKMTLLFIVPFRKNGVWEGALCGRVPNDVLGDLIQRESGHVYPDSGDNYLFMAEPALLRNIAPGTALSRSRFEDLAFTHGENLKDGVHTDWGTVQVKEHTELELVFTDPATGKLHPGVANTIKNGSNLFVAFPGYSDYRHVPVIGKGITFRLPHCPDLWGMMCEGDLEEVYRVRGISWKIASAFVWLSVLIVLLNVAMTLVLAGRVPVALQGVVTGAANLLGVYLAYSRLKRKYAEPTAERLRRISRFIRINAEGTGDLTQRLDRSDFAEDETGELVKWLNNMIDSLEGMLMRMKQSAADVQESQQLLLASTDGTERSTSRMSEKIGDMIGRMRRQLQDIDVAKDVSTNMSESLKAMEVQAGQQIAVAQEQVGQIGSKMQDIQRKVEQTNETIRIFLSTFKEIAQVVQFIEEISAQTNLLSLNASIEAARAGELGRGFAVVAGEIRKLAEQTKQSTSQIGGIVESIRAHAEEAIEAIADGNRAASEGARMAKAAWGILEASASGETTKSRVVEEMVAVMENIAQVSFENRRLSEEVEHTVAELTDSMKQARFTSAQVSDITGSLLGVINQFKLTEGRIR